MIAGPLLEVKGLSLWYPNQIVPTLRGVNLAVNHGEILLLTGVSGCGKSTLLSCLRGVVPEIFEAQIEGSILVDGVDVTAATVSSLSAHIGLVLQEPASQLCNLTVETEVAFGVENLLLPREECQTRVTDALDAVGLLEKRHSSVEALSGGECQRLAIASVLAMRPRVILLDEPTATLDSFAAAELIALIVRLRDQGHAIVIVQHDFEEILPLADKMCVLTSGAVAYFGTPADVVTALATSPARPIAIPAVSALAQRVGIATNGRLPITPEQVAAAIGHQLQPLRNLRCPPNQNSATTNGHSQPEILRAANVAFSYTRRSRRVVDDVDLSLYEGETLALVGRNGSGKSSLARLLVGLRVPISGSLTIDGKPLRRLGSRGAVRSTGYVFQFPDHQFVTSTVSDEIAYGLHCQGVDGPEAERIVLETAERLALAHALDRHPLTLSGGEKRRLSVATMLVLRPRILVLDEPTYGLDESNLDSLVSLLFRELRNAGSTIVVITHDMRVVSEYADRVVGMADGKAVFSGTPAELFDDVRLSSLGLVAPPLIRARALLRDEGWTFPDDALTVDTIASYAGMAARAAS